MISEDFHKTTDAHKGLSVSTLIIKVILYLFP